MFKNKFLFLGAPGVGKGTLAQLVHDQLGLFHLSTGDIFRVTMQGNGELSQTLKNYVNAGQYVPDELTNQIFWQFVVEQISKLQQGFILDGYPRTLAQLEFLNSKFQLDRVFHIQVKDPQILIERIANRVVCLQCKKVYNRILNPPKQTDICDQCNIKLIHRKDDDASVVMERLVVYQKTVQPLLEQFTQQKLLTTIDSQTPLQEQVALVQQFVK